MAVRSHIPEHKTLKGFFFSLMRGEETLDVLLNADVEVEYQASNQFEPHRKTGSTKKG